MASRIRIKIGALEVEYEGEEDYLKDGLLDFLKSVVDLAEVSEFTDFSGEGQGEEGDSQPPIPQPKGISHLAPETIAAKLNTKTGSDLVLAAAAYLKFTQGLGNFTRQQILEAMKEATGYYKGSMSNNLTRYLGSLVKRGRLNALANGKYSISAPTEKELRANIAI